MREQLQSEVERLVPPAGDGEVLVWPDVGALLELAEANRRLRAAYAFEVLGRPAVTIMEASRADGPVLMTGHQPTFFHPGVWAKHVVASALAGRLGGCAAFMVVDSDALHGFAMQWPEDGSGHCRLRSALPFSVAADRSYEQLPEMPPRRWRVFFSKPAAALRSLPKTALSSFVKGFLQDRSGVEGAEPDYVTRWIGGVSAVDRGVDVPSPRFRRVSELFSCRSASIGGWNSVLAGDQSRLVSSRSEATRPGSVDARRHGGALAFVAHLLLNAEAFAAAYNEALAAYRSRCGIRGRQRPMPDLVAAGERIELPFWLLHDSRPRERLSVSPVGGDGVRLWSGAEAICTLSRRELRANADTVVPQCLNGWEIRPRALALMMYARLFVCDLFIHGVGGAKYDQITDGIIRRFFGVEPPAYGCVSATLRLPLRVYEVTEADHQSCRQRLRDMPFNPQRHLSAPAPPQITRLLGERSRAIAESQRLRRQTPRDHGARREAFERVHRANEAVVAASPDLMERARDDLAAIRAQLGHNRTALSREWFFALYPVEKLGALREALQIDD